LELSGYAFLLPLSSPLPGGNNQEAWDESSGEDNLICIDEIEDQDWNLVDGLFCYLCLSPSQGAIFRKPGMELMQVEVKTI